MNKPSTQKRYEVSRMNRIPSVYYAESIIQCSLAKVWQCMLNYEAWNPSFVGAQVERVAGEPTSEGEVVLIKKSHPDAHGVPSPPFYAETVKVIPNRRIVWYVYPEDGNAFRNFVDFGLTDLGSSVRFNIDYYAQNALTAELVQKERDHSHVFLPALALALKAYCEKQPK